MSAELSLCPAGAPLGYDISDQKLVINETEAATVRRIFERLAKCGSATTVVRELTTEGFVNKYGQPLDKGRIYKRLNNRVYIGDAVHHVAMTISGERRPARAARKEFAGITEAEVRDTLDRFDPLWGELFPAEQARIVRLQVEGVQGIDGAIDINLRAAGLVSLLTDLRANPEREAA